MPEHDEDVPREEPTGSPGPRIDPAMLTAGGPAKSGAAAPEEFMEQLRHRVEAEGGMLLPGRTYEEADMARAALAALRGWPKQRDRLPADRADLMAAAWWSGQRNVAELARSADVSRDTVYEDLRARGIEPTDKAAAADPRPRYAPLTAEAVGGLAALSKSVTLPAILVQDPDELPLTAWALSNALERIADLLDPDGDNMRQWGRDEVAHDLAARLQTALHHAHAVAADGVSEQQLAGRALNRLSGQMDDEQYVVEDATVRLFHPDGDRVTVRIGQAQFSDFAPAGWTLLESDRPLRELTGAAHLAIRAALDTIAEALHSSLMEATEDASGREPEPATYDAELRRTKGGWRLDVHLPGMSGGWPTTEFSGHGPTPPTVTERNAALEELGYRPVDPERGGLGWSWIEAQEFPDDPAYFIGTVQVRPL